MRCSSAARSSANGSPVTPVPRDGALAQAPRRGVLGAVEPQAAAREHAHGRRGDPPVHEVEVVRRLVDEQPARVRLLPVPAAEVVGAVHRVERPLEVHRGHGADLAVGDDPAQRGVARAVAVVERRDHLASGLGDGRADAAHALGVDREGLLDDHVGAGPQGAHDVVGVGEVGGGHDDPVEALVADHPLEVVGRVAGRCRMPRRHDIALVHVEPARVHVAPCDELGDAGNVLRTELRARHRADVHARSAARADESVPFLLRHRVLHSGRRARKRFLRGIR